MKTLVGLTIILSCAAFAFGQSKDDYSISENGSGSKGLIDPSRFSVSHSMSLGMMSGGGSSSLQSQSFYSTMMQYRFTAPVTLNLNFSLPIYSTTSQYQNLSQSNLQSLNYFKNMPFDVSLAWKPTSSLQFNFSIVNAPGYYYGHGMYGDPFMPWYGAPMHR